MESIGLLRERRIGICLLIREQIPGDGRRSAGYDAIRRPHRVRVAVLADGRDGEVGRCDEHVAEVPREGDDVALGNFVVGRGGLGWLCDRDEARGCRLRDARYAGRRGRAGSRRRILCRSLRWRLRIGGRRRPLVAGRRVLSHIERKDLKSKYVPRGERKKVVGEDGGDGNEQGECDGEDKPFVVGGAETAVTSFCDIVTGSLQLPFAESRTAPCLEFSSVRSTVSRLLCSLNNYSPDCSLGLSSPVI